MADDYGASASAGNLGTVAIGGSTTGTLEAGADHDWFRITLVAGQSYIFNMDKGSLPDPFLILRDQNGVDIVGNDDIVTNVNFNSQIRFTATVSGTYFLDAFSSDGSQATGTGTYTVRAAIDPSPPASNDDYGAQAGSPTVGNLTVGNSINGNLETAGDKDWFAITLTAGTSYTFREDKGTGTLNDPFLRLRDGNGMQIAANDDIGGGNLNSLINYTAVTTGVYYLEANTADLGGTGTYTVSAAVNGSPPPPPVDDYGSQVGAGNLGSVAVGSTSTGLINYGGDHDWFTVTLSVGSQYRIRQEVGTLADPRFTLRNSIGGVLTGDDDSGGGQNAQVDYTATSSGTYYIDANSGDGTGTGNYTVRVTLLYGAPVIVTKTGSTAAEGASDTITSSELSTTDADTAPAAIVYTLTSVPTNGVLTRNGTTLAMNGTFTQADVNSNLVAYVHNGSETTSDSLVFRVTDGTTTFTGQTFAITVTRVNDAPAFASLNGTPGFTENGSAVVLDVNATVVDAELTGGNYAGATLTLARSGGAAAQDVFGTSGTIAFTGSGSGNVNAGATTIGTYTQSGGTLVITFNANATQSAVNTALQSLTYSNTSVAPPASAVIAYAFNDGNAGAQGSGGALTANGSVTVTITAVDNAPVAVADAFTTAENVVRTGTVAGNTTLTFNDTDVDGGPKTVASVNGVGGNVGTQITLTSGAKLTVQADGSYSYDPNGAFNYLVSTGKAATNSAYLSQATDTFTYALNGGSSTTVTITVNGVDGAGDQLRGTSGNNTITGTGAAEYFNVSQGGTDVVNAGDGNDTIFTGTGFDASDQIDGGPGTDQITLRGSYTGTLGNVTNTEFLGFLSGTSIRFGGDGSARYSYDVTTTNATVAAGVAYIVQANELVAGENLRFDGSAELDGSFVVYAGKGIDTFIGGAGDDGFFFGEGGRFTAADTVNGGGGSDQLGLRGNYTVTFGATTLTNVETIVLLSATAAGAAAEGAAYTYSLTLNDANVGLGQQLRINAAQLVATESVTVNGSAESNGTFVFIGGAGADSFTGGAGADTLYGGGGIDTLTGGGGNDIFQYRATSESAVGARDTITDFKAGDLIDLSVIDAVTGSSDDAFGFIGAGAFTGVAGQLRVTVVSPGNYLVEGDVDGVGGADFAINVTSDHAITAADFIL